MSVTLNRDICIPVSPLRATQKIPRVRDDNDRLGSYRL
jgi:hypothetical protein